MITIVFGKKSEGKARPLKLYSSGGERGPMKVTVNMNSTGHKGLVYLERLNRSVVPWTWERVTANCFKEYNQVSSILYFQDGKQLVFTLDIAEGHQLPLFRLIVVIYDTNSQEIASKQKYFGYRGRDKVAGRSQEYVKLLFNIDESDGVSERKVQLKLDAYPCVETDIRDLIPGARLLPEDTAPQSPSFEAKRHRDEEQSSPEQGPKKARLEDPLSPNDYQALEALCEGVTSENKDSLI